MNSQGNATKYAGIGFLLVISSYLLGWHGVPWFVDFEIHQLLMLKNGTFQYPMWEKLDIPLVFNIYFFNVTNVDAIQQGAKPIVQEIGPFCYNLFRDKIILDVSSDGEFITYYNRRVFYFTQDRPGCLSDKTEITMLNMALLATVHLLNDLAPEILETFEEAVPLLFPGIKSIFLTAKVEDILFNGLKLDCSSDEPIVGLICSNVQSLAPPQLWKHENNRDYLFSAFHYLNNTEEGPFTVNSGIKNASLIGYTEQWNGKSKTEYWGSDDCNTLKGSDGYVVAPLQGAKKAYFFQSDICRSLQIQFETETEVFGMRALKFVAPGDLLNATEANKCYCVKKMNQDTGEEELRCLKDGVLNLSPCFRAPIIVSWPHLLLAHSDYTNYTIGLHPNKELHEDTVYFEPVTSAPLKGYKRAQINLFLIKSEDITVLNNVSEGLFPILWLEEGTDLPENFRMLIKAATYALKTWNFVKLVLMFVGSVAIVYSLLLFMRQKHLFCFDGDDSPQAEQTEVNDFTKPQPQSLPQPRHQQSTTIGNVAIANRLPPDISAFSIMELSKYPKLPNNNTLLTNLENRLNNQYNNRNSDVYVSHF